MMKSFPGVLLFSIVILFSACQNDKSDPKIETIQTIVTELKQQFAPDRRVARLDVEVENRDGVYILAGESDQIEGVNQLIAKLKHLQITFKDSIRRLPDETTVDFPFAVVNNSVANIRSKPKHSAELATQATLGTALKVLKITEEWYMVQTPDDYISWVDHGGVKLMSALEFQSWEEANKIIVTSINSNVYAQDDTEVVISDLVLGNRLKIIDTKENAYLVEFPDGRTGIVKKEHALRYDQWLRDVQTTGESLEAYAKRLMGVPYLWGGTSVKGMDCSGFTKTVFFMNGLVIPRDASQQIEAGEVIDEDLAFDGLDRGDLLFFGKPATDSTKRKTTHVGIWLGNGEFIHASKRVRISSIDPASEYYDEFNKNRYLGSRRYIDSAKGNILDLRSRITLK